MHTKDSIYDHLKNILIELFEVAPEAITPSASLYEDLDVDSIDAVDMAVKLKELTGRKIQPSDFKHVRSVQDVVDAVYCLINPDNEDQASNG